MDCRLETTLKQRLPSTESSWGSPHFNHYKPGRIGRQLPSLTRKELLSPLIGIRNPNSDVPVRFTGTDYRSCSAQSWDRLLTMIVNHH